MGQHYSDPMREPDPHALPNIETFRLTATEVAARDEDTIHEYMRRHEFRLASMNRAVYERMIDAIVENEGITGGWFWHACFPGCLPDGEAFGPFPTEADAVEDARDVLEAD